MKEPRTTIVNAKTTKTIREQAHIKAKSEGTTLSDKIHRYLSADIKRPIKKYKTCPVCGTEDITNNGVCFYCGDVTSWNK